jgi:hypothetical protein
LADLAAGFAVGVGAVSKSIDRLENRGWVARRPNPNDRRSAVLALTGAGRALVDAAAITFETRLDQLIGAVAARGGESRRVLVRWSRPAERSNVPVPTGSTDHCAGQDRGGSGSLHEQKGTPRRMGRQLPAGLQTRRTGRKRPRSPGCRSGTIAK